MGNFVKISVRGLVEYVLRRGSIDSTFVGTSVLVEGVRAHQKIQGKQGDNYESEVSLKMDISYKDSFFKIEGRCDGIIKEDVIIIDEIKSTRRELEYIEEDHNEVYWGQGKVYAYMYAKENNIENIKVQLTYMNINTEEEKRFIKEFTIDELEEFIYYLLEEYKIYADLRMDMEEKRQNTIKDLDFPFPSYRKGQRELAVSIYKTIRNEKRIFAKAPTGTGKTISTLFPAIKALGENKIEKIIYLTAKTITKKVAEETLNILLSKGLSCKSTTITAKEKICFMDEVNCNKEHCHYADGYYNKLNKAIIDIFENENMMDRETIEKYSEKHGVCPFEFSLDLSLLSPIVVCDYNYFFDPRASLKRLNEENKNSYGVLIDEAHNLVDRSREMFSASLNKSDFLDLKRKFKNKDKDMHRHLNKINSYMIDLRKEREEKSFTKKDKPKDINRFLNGFVSKAEKWLMDNKGDEDYKEVLDLYFNCNSFVRILKLYDERYITYVEKSKSEVTLKLFCLDPSHLLREITKNNRATIFFSATLSPMKYYKEVLGSDEDDYNVMLPFPFDRDNIKVYINKVSTRYKDRENTYEKIVNTISDTLNKEPGNTLIFFPSYSYMYRIYEIFIEKHGHMNIIVQDNHMSEEEREEFLEEFSKDERVIGFAVLGGIFSEGIDLREEKLEGVIIVGVGLPQLCFERNIIKEYYDSNEQWGYDYSYVYPGMNKVLQAGGRLIRTERDKGFLLLMDDRFLTGKYQNMIPYEWKNFKLI
ncbi:ATP-dependent DNA helicase [Anaeromicrobium sediminis]|uniref:ATP-dependent helicase n=1 Tax=Anaeromicrobium sediminis TaxID=1478221 RepID=A0A267MM09_9FIRM|nr:ATP-dependent DNA helicase [Anaeromicrobium sediminis]PAB60576.1 ATP-dependent helicase [Anaeromicrobium sediminis]